MIVKRLDKLNRVNYLLVIGMIVVALNFLIAALAELTGQYAGGESIENWWSAVLVAPIIETLMFQAATYWVLNLFDFRDTAVVILSGLLFGFAHFRDWHTLLYVVSATLAGCIFSWIYIRRKNQQGGFFQAFLDVVSVHLFNNVVVIAISVI